MNTPFVYVLTHSAFRSIKIGHSTERSERLETFRRYGWQPFQRLYVQSPTFAYSIEQTVLFDLRHRLNVPAHLPASVVPQGGWTETLSASLVPARTVWSVVCTQACLLWLQSDQPRRRPDNRQRRIKPLDPVDVDKVRKLAELLGGAEHLSARKVRETVGGCSQEYAVRLRDAVQGEAKKQGE